jgi:hypothetical protein
MRLSRLLLVGVVAAFAPAAVLLPQSPTQSSADSPAKPSQPDAQTDSRPVQPAPDMRTDSKPAATQTSPDLRTDSKPKTAVAPETDSTPLELDLGGNAPGFLDLGFDPNVKPPAGMIAKSPADNPLLFYLALEHRSGDTIAAADASLIASRQADLVRAAALHGYDLKQSGWLYQQAVCPQTESGPATGSGVVVLHFVRHAPGRDEARGIESLFTAIVPRDDRKVRVIAVLHRNTTPFHAALHGGQNSLVVNEAIPEAALYQHLEPRADWVATSACVAEMAGAYPHIPSDPSLDRFDTDQDRITTAPSPLLRLLVNGDRKVTFPDREDIDHYSVWEEATAHTGRFLEATHKRYSSPALAVTTPPEPAPLPATAPPDPPKLAVIVPPQPPVVQDAPQPPPVLPVSQPPLPATVVLPAPPPPPTVMMPLPPSPLSGDHQ